MVLEYLQIQNKACASLCFSASPPRIGYLSLWMHQGLSPPAPEMIPTPKWTPTLKWSPNRPRNDPHFSSCRPRNDPQGIREWWLMVIKHGTVDCFFVLCWNAAILSFLFILVKFQVKGNYIVFVGSPSRSIFSPIPFRSTFDLFSLIIVNVMFRTACF